MGDMGKTKANSEGKSKAKSKAKSASKKKPSIAEQMKEMKKAKKAKIELKIEELEDERKVFNGEAERASDSPITEGQQTGKGLGHHPTEETRELVRTMREQGKTQSEIGALLGISNPTVAKHYKVELKTRSKIKKSRGGSKEYNFSQQDRDNVTDWYIAGFTQSQIAEKLRINTGVLQAHFRDELELGKMDTSADAVRGIRWHIKNKESPNHYKACIEWLQFQNGWSKTELKKTVDEAVNAAITRVIPLVYAKSDK